MNKALFDQLYQFPKVNGFGSQIPLFLGSYLPYILAIGLAGYLFIYGNKLFPFKRRLFIVVGCLFAGILGYMGALIFQSIYQSQRPFATLPDITPFIDPGKAIQSFPSIHTAVFFAVGMFLYFYHRRLGILYLTAALLVGTGRIMSGIHWPADIVVGAVIGVGAGFLLRWFTLSIKRNL